MLNFTKLWMDGIETESILWEPDKKLPYDDRHKTQISKAKPAKAFGHDRGKGKRNSPLLFLKSVIQYRVFPFADEVQLLANLLSLPIPAGCDSTEVLKNPAWRQPERALQTLAFMRPLNLQNILKRQTMLA